MNIAFDAKRAFQNTTGLGHYSRTLIASLATYFPQHNYYLYAPKVTGLFDTGSFSNIQTVTPLRFPSTVFRSAWRSSLVKEDLKRFGIDLYHGLSHEIPAGIQKTGIRTVVTMHDLIHERYPQQYNPIDVMIYRKKFRYACTHADIIIAASKQTKQDIIDFYKIPGTKIEICYQSCNSIFARQVSEDEKRSVRKRYRLPENYFLYVGTIIQRKNLLGICKALDKVKDTLNLPLVVIGDGGKYKQQVKEYIAGHNLQQQVIFLSEQPEAKDSSFKSSEDFPAIYQNARALIYPSYFEGFGIPVLEALCSNLPVITSNQSCLPETGGDAAYYVNPADTDELANALIKVAGDEALRQSMITKGRLHAEHFSPKTCAGSVMNVYQKLLS